MKPKGRNPYSTLTFLKNLTGELAAPASVSRGHRRCIPCHPRGTRAFPSDELSKLTGLT